MKPRLRRAALCEVGESPHPTHCNWRWWWAEVLETEYKNR